MNPLETLLRQPQIVPLGWALLHFLWQGALIAFLLGVLNVLLRRASARVRYGAACLAMLLMLGSVVTTFAWLSLGAAPGGRVPAILDGQPRDILSAVAGRVMPAASSFAWSTWLNDHLAWLVTVWFAGVVILSVRTAGGWIVAQSLKRSARPSEPAWQQTLARLASRLGIRRTISLCESGLAKSPSVIGWVKPVLLLPVSAITALTPEMMEAILAHELAHIRRHDYLVNLMQTAIETLLFYHPAVWWVCEENPPGA